MKRAYIVILVPFFFAVLADASLAREIRDPGARPSRYWAKEDFSGFDFPGPFYEQWTAAVDTYCIVYYTFEPESFQGWTRLDKTAQPDTFWHVEDYLEPELAGFPGPLEGAKSAWCGALPGDGEYMCTWADAPGYGNAWDQGLVSEGFQFANPLVFEYKLHYDSEPGYDCLHVEYDAGLYEWVEIVSYDGTGDTVAVHSLFLSRTKTKLRFHFTSDGAWSDEDGLWDTDGAAHVDSIVISDAHGPIDYEDFESAADSAVSSGIWHADVAEPFGTYSGLWSNLNDKDPCSYNTSSQIVFFVNSPYMSTEYPGLPVTPYCKGGGGFEEPCQDEYVVSPIIDMTRYSTGCNEVQDADIPPGELPHLGGVLFKFTVYRDLAIHSLVWYNWHVRSIGPDGCPGDWRHRDGIGYYGATRDYVFTTNWISDMVTEDSIQVALAVHDMCYAWYMVYGDCEDHTPSPWFDNVKVLKYSTKGPQWSYRGQNLFQDNFPGGADIEGYIRADMANDLLPGDNPAIRPGDSIVVDCTSPTGGGIAEDGGGPRVYIYVKVTYIGDPMNPKTPPSGVLLEGTYGHYTGMDGDWTVIQGDTAMTGSGYPCNDRYMFDLNDSLLTRGFMVEYYFKAYDNDGESTTLPQWAADAGPHPYRGGSMVFEFTCLPSLASDILFVDDFDGRGTFAGMSQQYLDPTFDAVIAPENFHTDRYDVNSPSYGVSNGPGSRARNDHLVTAYNTIIWDSGDLGWCTISDGAGDATDKSDDCQMLIDWMNTNTHDCGLWVMGDGVAQEMSGSSKPHAIDLLNNKCGVMLQNADYHDLTGGFESGGIITPLVTTVTGSGGPFDLDDNSFNVYSGCPVSSGFDVLEKTGNGHYALRYPDYGGEQYYAGIWSSWVNGAAYTVKTVWFGFGFAYIRDDVLSSPIDRNMIMCDVIEWFGSGPTNPDITDGDGVPAVYALSQNYPNPFNPVTTIRYSVKKKGPVALRIYDVAGRLVRTLVDDVKKAGSHSAAWDGSNNEGLEVASGVYFYRIEAGGFVKTKKMVLLK